MAYTLNGTDIRRPSDMEEDNSTQYASNRTLGGANVRDYFGSNKRVWKLDYNNINSTDFTTINSIYSTYLSTQTAVTWEITETNYTVSSTTVHVDFQSRSFNVPGSTYLSNCVLILTEA